MTSLERVLAALQHKEPDRVPFFLLVTMHGARELGMSIKEYFSEADNIVRGQLRMRARYRHDCIYAFSYAASEVEAWGGEVVFREDGPPIAGEPIVRQLEDVEKLSPPRIEDAAGLVKMLSAIGMLKASVGDAVPIIGVALSPFSLPVIQMGFDRYIELMYERPELMKRLMEINEEFCVAWANAQLEAGATAITYFDPVSSPTITPREMFLRWGFRAMQRATGRIKGPVAVHLASGRCLPIVDDLARAGTPIIGTSTLENLAELKAACRGKLCILGNLNGIEMRNWTPQQTETVVKDAIARAGPGGGFILSDNHGEIPWQVPEGVLEAISEAVHLWGRYPLDWTNGDGRRTC